MSHRLNDHSRHVNYDHLVGEDCGRVAKLDTSKPLYPCDDCRIEERNPPATAIWRVPEALKR